MDKKPDKHAVMVLNPDAWLHTGIVLIIHHAHKLLILPVVYIPAPISYVIKQHMLMKVFFHRDDHLIVETAGILLVFLFNSTYGY
jgi:hypothetical protein